MGEWLDAIGEWLTVWSSYRPRNFLMFAPRTYWRLFELHNGAWWPLHAATLAFGALALRTLARLAPRAGAGAPRAPATWVFAGLALACAFVGAAFVFECYGSINWAARGWAGIYGLLAVALAALAWGAAHGPRIEPTPGERRFGLALLTWALFGQPLLAPLAGRPWLAAEVFGIAPDPTVLGALAVLVLAAPRGAAPPPERLAWHAAWWLAWLCAAGSAATLATMRQWEALAPAAACAMALALTLARRRASA
jgi:hypothetical protein